VDEASIVAILQEVRADEVRCYALSDSLAQLLEESENVEEVLHVEIEALTVIAEEFLAEGDSETASELFEEAIALLAPPPGGSR
jgi:hypothetical protein